MHSKILWGILSSDREQGTGGVIAVRERPGALKMAFYLE